MTIALLILIWATLVAILNVLLALNGRDHDREMRKNRGDQ